MSVNFAVFAGKKIGYESLKFLLKIKKKPKLVILNDDDNGKDTVFHKSCLKLAKSNKLNYSTLSRKISLSKKFDNLDYIFCLGSTKIIPNDILRKVKIGSINIHPSILPKYRGRYSTVNAILNGKNSTGLTVHWIGKEIDYGNIIKTKKIIIKQDYTAKDLYDKFTIEAINEFKKLFKDILKNKKITSKKIKNIYPKYTKKKLPFNGIINWNWNNKKILNFIRAMTHEPFEPPKFFLGKKIFYVVEKNLIKKEFLKSPK